MRVRRLLAAAGALVLSGGLIVAVPTSASAATFTVNSNGDQPDQTLGDGICMTAVNTCTLRAAVEQANATAGTDTVSLPPMTVTLGSQLLIGTSMNIVGSGSRATIVTGTAGHVNVNVSSSGDVGMSDLAIQDVTTNQAFGAGIFQTAGTLTLTRVRVSGIKVTTSLTAYGPVLVQGGKLVMTDSEVSGNQTQSTAAAAYGGGIAATASGRLEITNSTIANNAVAANGNYFALGGGIYATATSTVEVTSSTLAQNSATAASSFGRGGNVLMIANGAGYALFRESILAGGTDSSSSGGNCAVVNGEELPLFSGHNLIDDSTCGPEAASLTTKPADLLPLGNYGGSTNSRPPGPTSKALNAASMCSTNKDQRGQARPIGGACDLGAVELGADVSVAAAVSNATPNPGGDVVVTVSVSNAGMDTATGTSASVTPSAGEVLSATTTQGTCATGPTAVACGLGDLPGGATATITIALRAPGSGSVSVPASVSAQQPDPDQADNVTSAALNVAAVSAPPTGSAPSTGGTTPTTTTAGQPSGAPTDSTSTPQQASSEPPTTTPPTTTPPTTTPPTTTPSEPTTSTPTTTDTTGQTAGTPVVTASGRCANVISGSGKSNRLAGTAGGDRITGKAGNDRIKGLGGDDCLSGDGGADVLVGGPGKDTVAGGAGGDTIKVKDGTRDRITCGGGRDTVLADRTDRIAKDCEVVRR